MADRIVVLNGGGIAQVGSVTDVYRDPDNAFVAGFIGSPEINFLPATAAETGERHVLVAGDLKMPLGRAVHLHTGASHHLRHTAPALHHQR